MNSTAFGVYDLEIKDGALVAKMIKVGSSLVYNIFGVDGQTQHSFSLMVMNLKTVKSGSVASPANAQNYDDLRFEFENELKEDEDIKKPQPFFFHHKGLDLDKAGQDQAENRLIENIHKIHMSLKSADVYKDTKEFHKVSPFTLMPFVAAMDYDHLKEVYGKVKGGDETE